MPHSQIRMNRAVLCVISFDRSEVGGWIIDTRVAAKTVQVLEKGGPAWGDILP